MDSINESPERFFRELSIDGGRRTAQIHALVTDIEAVLEAMPTEDSQTIVGTLTDEYRLLLRAARASSGLLWANMRRYGLRHNSRSNKRMRQALMFMGELVHRAYAMGIRRGWAERERTDESGLEETERSTESGPAPSKRAEPGAAGAGTPALQKRRARGIAGGRPYA